jgi:LysR family glycine cleavage system transcriptional activator
MPSASTAIMFTPSRPRRWRKEHKLNKPADLKNQTVLVHSDMPLIFDAWREAVGEPRLRPAAIDHIDSGQLMLEAAANGLGVAIMHGSHFSDAKDPRLVRLFDVEVESPYSYWFVCRPRALKQRCSAHFPRLASEIGCVAKKPRSGEV